MHAVLFCFVLLMFYHQLLWIRLRHFPIFFRITSLVLGQSYDCPSDSEAIQKDMGELACSRAQRNTTKHELCPYFLGCIAPWKINHWLIFRLQLHVGERWYIHNHIVRIFYDIYIYMDIPSITFTALLYCISCNTMNFVEYLHHQKLVIIYNFVPIHKLMNDSARCWVPC